MPTLPPTASRVDTNTPQKCSNTKIFCQPLQQQDKGYLKTHAKCNSKELCIQHQKITMEDQWCNNSSILTRGTLQEYNFISLTLQLFPGVALNFHCLEYISGNYNFSKAIFRVLSTVCCLLKLLAKILVSLADSIAHYCKSSLKFDWKRLPTKGAFSCEIINVSKPVFLCLHYFLLHVKYLFLLSSSLAPSSRSPGGSY